MDKRGWMVGLVAFDLKVPAEEFGAELMRQAYLCTKAGPDIKPIIRSHGDGTLIGLSMDDESFLVFGVYLLHWLFGLCDPHSAEEGNEFLCCYGNGEGEAPAKWIYATLWVTWDNGDNWCPADDVTVVDQVPAPKN